jgi:putative redox protein
MEKHITVRWGERDLDFTGASDDGASVALGGETAPGTFRPAALLLVSLASCTGMDAISVLTKKRIPVASYEVDAIGTQREEHPKSFSRIVLEHIVRGPTISDKAVQRAVELSATKYCIVGATIAGGDCEIEHKVRVVDDDGERTCDCVTIGPRGRNVAGSAEAS